MKKGFSLIELLVVIGIIATLTGLALPNYMGARQRARDAKRKAELHELKQALRLYYNDFETYPASNAGGGIDGCGDGTEACVNPPNPAAVFATDTTTYMRRLPVEYVYELDASSNGEDFRVSFALETASDNDIEPSWTRCPPINGNAAWAGTTYVVCAD